MLDTETITVSPFRKVYNIHSNLNFKVFIAPFNSVDVQTSALWTLHYRMH